MARGTLGPFCLCLGGLIFAKCLGLVFWVPILKNETRKKSAVSIKISFVNLPFWAPGWPGALWDPLVVCRGGLIFALCVSIFAKYFEQNAHLCIVCKDFGQLPRAKCTFMHCLQSFLQEASGQMHFWKKVADRASIWHVNVAEKIRRIWTLLKQNAFLFLQKKQKAALCPYGALGFKFIMK